MKKILLYIILFLSGIDGAWALPIEKEGMSIYSPSLKQEVSYSIILPEGYEHSDTEYPVLYMFHGIGGDYTSWLEYGNVARVMDKMIKEGKIQPFMTVTCLITVTLMMAAPFMKLSLSKNWFHI